MQELFSQELKRGIRNSGVIAVLVIEDAELAVPVARTLLEGGISAMELTLRTPAALEALKRIRSDVPQMLAGVGTILRADQVKEVAAAGAEFGVAPGYNPRVVDAAKAADLAFAPGVATATELEWALEQGCRILKFFPAEPLGGIPYLKSMNSPYSYLDLQYVPLGGVNQDNLRAWLEQSFVIAVGGSWIANKQLIAAQDWDEIRRRAEQAHSIFKEVRG
jgi:2-dehydro-3-deoxyphosphogluconate aldolase/(4S)-4-hydroxy-2-oxoglutarate aldolase